MSEVNKILKEAMDKVSKIEKDFYEKQIRGLILVLQQNDGLDNGMIARCYVIQKLNMILNGGIGFHPRILEKLE